jgi:hypothetical protein
MSADPHYPVLQALLDDPERTPLEGARPVLRRLDEEDPDVEAEFQRLAPLEVALERRGHWYGRWVELPAALDQRARLPRVSRQRQRLKEARPLVWAGALSGALPRWRNELHASQRLGDLLWPTETGASATELRRWLLSRLPARGSEFELLPGTPSLHDPERDLARIELRARLLPADRPPLWIKLGRLSTHPADRSLRLRVGFGLEGADDANSDPELIKTLARLAQHLWPERAALSKDRVLLSALEEVFEQPLRPSADIAYWNRPQGGARFHHDAFAEHGDAQLGVLFAQWVGRTAWVALSINDLARRALEFHAELTAGEAEWVRQELASTGALEALARLSQDPLALLRELGQPGQGALGALIDQGPEFLGYLAERGHAAILHPGDLILLPNHGRLSTAMHSVFCASSGPNYALSLGLFAAGRTSASRD